MGGDLIRPESGLDRGLKRLMTVIGVVLVATPLAELAVQLTNGERPQILLLGGFCLIGILTVSHATRGRPAPVDGRGTPARRTSDRHLAGDALWLPDRLVPKRPSRPTAGGASPGGSAAYGPPPAAPQS